MDYYQRNRSKITFVLQVNLNNNLAPCSFLQDWNVDSYDFKGTKTPNIEYEIILKVIRGRRRNAAVRNELYMEPLGINWEGSMWMFRCGTQ